MQQFWRGNTSNILSTWNSIEMWELRMQKIKWWEKITFTHWWPGRRQQVNRGRQRWWPPWCVIEANEFPLSRSVTCCQRPCPPLLHDTRRPPAHTIGGLPLFRGEKENMEETQMTKVSLHGAWVAQLSAKLVEVLSCLGQSKEGGG
jgi:hypothetical protein